MPEISRESSLFSTPAMSVEGTPELELPVAAIRLSGFFALLLGLISFVSVLGETLILVSIVAALLAIWAIRPYKGDRPVGVIAGRIGLFCAILFGVWGYSERHFKHQTMSSQAIKFANAWLDLISEGNLELAVEMQAHPARRQPESMPLEDYYVRSESAIRTMTEFKEQDPIDKLIKLTKKPQWELAGEPYVYQIYGREMTETIWKDITGAHSERVKVVMELLSDTSLSQPEWRVEMVSGYIDPESLTPITTTPN